MTVQIVRFTTTEAQVAEVDAGVATLIAALDETRPAGTRYAACRLADGVTYLLLLELADGVDNPLPTIPAARAFQQRLPGWAVEPLAPEPVTVVGAHGLFDLTAGPGAPRAETPSEPAGRA